MTRIEVQKPALLIAVGALFVAIALWVALRSGAPSRDSALVLRERATASTDPAPERASLPVADPARDAERALATDTVETRRDAHDTLLDDATVPPDALRIPGRVVIPAGTPPEPELWVIARGGLFDGPRMSREHRARVAPDGSFRASFARRSLKGTLALESRWLFLSQLAKVNTKEPPLELVLEPTLGGVIAGSLSLPADVAPKPTAFVEVRVTARRTSQELGGQVGVTTTPDMNGEFELFALFAGAPYRLEVSGGPYLPLVQEQLVVRAGECTRVELALELGLGLAGRVVDERGLGVGAVNLELEHEGARLDGTSSTKTFWQSTDAEGRFALRGLAGGRLALSASKEGYVATRLELGELRVGEMRDGLELVLREGLAVEGVVRWPDGEPAAGAKIELVQAQRPDVHRGVSDAAGRFRITGLLAGSCELRASANAPQDDGQRSTKTPGWIAQPCEVPAGTRDLVLVLSSGLSVSGRVEDDAGRALDDFKIEARGVDTDQRVRGSFSGAGGRFELHGLAPGAWNVRADANDHAESIPWRVELPHTGPELALVVVRTGTITGRVIDAEGAPVANADVYAKANDGRDGNDRTDDDGCFRLRRMAPGDYQLRADHEQRGGSEWMELALAPGATIEERTLVLRAPASLTITVHPAAGNVAGRRVDVSGIRGSRWESVTTDGNGRIELAGLSPGKYSLTLHPELDTGRSTDGVRALYEALRQESQIELAPGAREIVVLGAPPASAVRVTGRVTEADRPVVELVVVFEGRSKGATRTDADGRFALELAGPGRYAVSVGSANQFVIVDIPDVREHDLELALPTATIRGRVRDAEGRPAVGCPLELVREHDVSERNVWFQRRLVTTDAEGRFESTHLIAGSYTLTAGGERSPRGRYDGESFPPRRLGGLELVDGATLDGIELDLPSPATLRGTVRGPDGQPVARAYVEITWPSGERLHACSGWTDEAGHFELSTLPPDQLQVRATRHSQTSDMHPLDLRALSSTTLDLVLHPR